MAVDLHRIAEKRSLAYHALIAERLRTDSKILARARGRVAHWLEEQQEPPFHARQWSNILARDEEAIRSFLTDPGEIACELRQSSPFAGALDPHERWELWRRCQSEIDG